MARSERTKPSRNSILGRQQGTGRGGRAAPPGQSQSRAPDEAELVGCDQTIYVCFRRWLYLGLRRPVGACPAPLVPRGLLGISLPSGVVGTHTVNCIGVRGP